MKTFAFVIEVVVDDEHDKTFIVRHTNGNVFGICQSVGAAAECIDSFTDPVPAPSQAADAAEK